MGAWARLLVLEFFDDAHVDFWCDELEEGHESEERQGALRLSLHSGLWVLKNWTKPGGFSYLRRSSAKSSNDMNKAFDVLESLELAGTQNDDTSIVHNPHSQKVQSRPGLEC